MTERMLDIALRGLSKLGLTTSSDAHESSNAQLQDPQATPIIVLGFARTGTTTIQVRLAQALAYNWCFEPFANSRFLPSGIPDVNKWFMGAPAQQEYNELCRPTGCALAPESITDLAWKGELSALLESQLRAIHSAFGWNCVWKEIRLVPTLPSIRAAYSRIGREPTFVGVLGNPLGCLYAYYRLLALGPKPRGNGLHPGMIWDYRKAAYESMGFYPAIAAIQPTSPAESLVQACLLDQEFLQTQAKQHHRSVLLTDLNSCNQLIDNLRGHSGGSAGQSPSQPPRVPKWARDPWFRELVVNRLSPEVLDAIVSRWPMPEAQMDLRSGRAWWTHVLNRFGALR